MIQIESKCEFYVKRVHIVGDIDKCKEAEQWCEENGFEIYHNEEKWLYDKSTGKGRIFEIFADKELDDLDIKEIIAKKPSPYANVCGWIHKKYNIQKYDKVIKAADLGTYIPCPSEARPYGEIIFIEENLPSKDSLFERPYYHVTIRKEKGQLCLDK